MVKPVEVMRASIVNKRAIGKTVTFLVFNNKNARIQDL
jgi:hypothetical protein